jgi:hypothetical protein
MANASKKVDVFKEMSALGKQVHAALDAAAKSDELHDIRSELGKSFRSISAKIGDAVQSAKESQRGRAIGKQVKKVVKASKEQGLEAGKELTKQLASGLRELSGRLAKTAEKLKKK